MSDARRYAVWPEPRSRSLKGSRPSVPHGTNFYLVIFFVFVELRKQACQLENEIDLKLVSFSKLGTNYRSVREYSPFQSVAHRPYYK